MKLTQLIDAQLLIGKLEGRIKDGNIPDEYLPEQEKMLLLIDMINELLLRYYEKRKE